MKIVEIVRSYVGQKEIPGNKGWKNKTFQEKMEQAGWLDGEAWCALFAEVCYKEAYPCHYHLFDKLFSKSATETLKNFKGAGFEISTIPKVGSLCVMRRYDDNKPSWQGHISIVTELITNTEWRNVEGNTTPLTGSRDGEEVAERPRTLLYHPSGLRVEGFVLVVDSLLCELNA